MTPAQRYLALVHRLHCVVCRHLGLEQSTPTVAHHVESVRDSLSDYAVVAICDAHHRELHHVSRRGFEVRYKLSPIDLLAMTIKEYFREFA